MPRGPKPTPSKLNTLRGNPGKRKTNKAEPSPPPGPPDPPAWLTGPEALEAWHEIVGTLDRMGIATTADAHVLARYASTHARWRAVVKFLDENGEVYTIKDEKGRPKYVQQWPQVNIAARLADQLMRIETEFGLTPSSRTRVTVSPTLAPTNPLAKFIEGKPAPAISAG